MDTVNFTRMEDGTKEEYEFLARHESEFADAAADRLLEHLRSLENSLSGYRVSRLEHSLQTATRAHRDGADTEMVVAALLHDIGDNLAPWNHGEMAAAILRPYVSEKTHWVIKHHGIFQGYYYFHHLGMDRNLREEHADSPHYQDCVDFCAKWDQTSFDPEYDSEPLEFFEPMLREVFSRTPFHHPEADL